MDLSSPGLEHRKASGLQKAAVALVALVLTTMALYHETVLSLLLVWTTSYTYTYGLLLVGICAFLFYRRWVEVAPLMQVRPSPSAGLLVLVTSLAWLFASLVDVLIVQQLTLVLMLGLLVVTVVGYRSAWLFAAPGSLLIFTLPVWDLLVPYLQRLTASAATVLLNLTGIPAFRQGIEISVPAGTFAVIPPCSGINQLLVGMVVACLFAYTKRLRLISAAWVFAGAVGVCLLTNSLRVYITVVIGQLTGMQQYSVFQHSAPAWVLFGVGMFLFFYLAGRWTGPSRRAASGASAQAAAAAVAGDKNVVQSALLSAAGLVLGPALFYAYQASQGDIGRFRLGLPAEIAGWQAAPVVVGVDRPVFQGPDLEYESLYRDGQAHEVYLYVAGYARQEQGKEAVYAANRAYDDQAWGPVLTRTRDLGGGATVRETRLESRSGTEKLVWQWYYVHGLMVNSGYMAKLLNAWGTLNGDPTIAAVVVTIDLKNGYDGYDSSEGSAVLARFVADTRPTLERAIEDSRQP